MELLPAEIIEIIYGFLNIDSRINFALTDKFTRGCKPNFRQQHKKIFKYCLDEIIDIKYDIYKHPLRNTTRSEEIFGAKLIASNNVDSYSVRNIKNTITILIVQDGTFKFDFSCDKDYIRIFGNRITYELIHEIIIYNNRFKNIHLINEIIIDSRIDPFRHIFNSGAFKRIQNYTYDINVI
jgi:hypothetical protein